jgi:uncharacterized membrane protein YjjB (DUF3815 family)
MKDFMIASFSKCCVYLFMFLTFKTFGNEKVASIIFPLLIGSLVVDFIFFLLKNKKNE